jgi:fermentation-respiration switch protein FrsA (DUF1100 family)
MSRQMIIAAVSILIVVVSILALIWTQQRRLIYFPTADVPASNAIDGAHVDPVTFETTDGLTLNGWFFASAGLSPRVTVIVFNGNAGNRSHRVPLAAALHRHGLQVFLVDYRGYGENHGTPSQAGLSTDSRAAWAYLANRPDVDPSRLVYFGESLGTAVAVDLAVDHPPAALVLRSPFTSMSDVGQYHYPFLPVHVLLRDRFALIDQISQSRAPVLVIAGGRDRIVPVESSRRVYEAAVSPKTFLLIPEADHNDYELFAGDEMISAIVRFLQPLK